ncbi:MAG: hypothetical protein L3J03_06570 [Desulfobacterales bacterium]|nr:hypothetical protein [Desulfobacterales bacterium]
MYNSRIVTEEESRNARRKEHHNVSCRFDNDPHDYKIHELSAHGFSFICSKEVSHFKRGVVLEKIHITNAEGVEIIVASGKIVHSTEFDFEQNRFGVHYLKKVLDRTTTGQIRVPRHFPEIELHAFLNLSGEKNNGLHTGIVKDFTATTARIAFDHPAIGANVGGEVRVVFEAETKELFQATAQILRKTDDGAEVIVHFLDKLLDVDKINSVSAAYQNRKVISAAVRSLKKYSSVADSFKSLVSDWRMYLQRLKRVLDQEERKNIYRSQEEQEYFLQGIEDKIFSDLHEFVERLNDFADNMLGEDGVLCKEYFRENLNPYFRTSPYASSVIERPNGYAGDYETIKFFFKNPYIGESLFGKLINKHLCSMDAVIAHQERIDFLYDELVARSNYSTEAFSFLSLGSGPAEEVLRLVGDKDFAISVHANLLDMDAFALADFSERLQYLPHDNFSFELININILDVLRKKESDPAKGKFSMTYCAGLFDYFSDVVCKKLIRYLLGHTSSNGVVLLTNVHKNNTTRHFMEFCGGWEIIHRDDEEMKRLVPPGHEVELSFDRNHANIFMKIVVPSELE